MKSVPKLANVVRPLGPYSHAVIANGFVFISGQTPLKPGQTPAELSGTSITEQTRQCLRNVDTVLKGLGGSLGDVVKVTVYLSNPSDFQNMNEGYKDFFPSDPPARSVARLGAEVQGLLVSVDAIAVHATSTLG